MAEAQCLEVRVLTSTLGSYSGRMIQINAAARLPPKMAHMATRLSTIEVAAIAIIVLSVAVIAFVGFSILAEP
jgi:hypothetical protein